MFKKMTQAQREGEFLEAAKEGGVMTVTALIELGTNVNVGTSFHTTALMFAASGGHKNVLQALLNAGAQINAANLYGETALLFAVKNGHLDIVKILLQAKANVNVTDLQGHSPLSYASVREYREIAFYLLNALSALNVSPKFEHDFISEYNKIKEEIFIAVWTMNLRIGQPNLKALKILKDNNLIINILLSLRPEGYPQDLYLKEINLALALVVKLKNKPQNKEKQSEIKKETVAPVILSNGHKPKRIRHRKAKAGVNTAIDKKNSFSYKP